MRVVHLTAFGGPEVLRPAEAPDPEPRPGHVVVDLVRAALNHREVWIREGRPGPLPAVLGSDGAGVDPDVLTVTDPDGETKPVVFKTRKLTGDPNARVWGWFPDRQARIGRSPPGWSPHRSR